MADAFEMGDDAIIAEAVRNGDTAAFRALYFRYAQPLFGYLWRRTHHRDVAEDLVQELFTKIWDMRSRLDPTKSIRAYLYQSANHMAIDHLRQKMRRHEVADQGLQVPTTAIDELGPERSQAISKAISELPEAQRNVFILSRFDGLKYTEIAAALGISVKTVETHIGRALKKLRNNLAEWMTSIVFLLGIWG